MRQVIRVTAALAALAAILAGCGESDAGRTVVDWNDPATVATFDGGWTIAACEGDAPMLCVERDGTGVGTVEAASYPIASLGFMDPGADADTNLRALAADYVAAFRADRAAGCGADYVVDDVPPEAFALDDAPGLVYGFTGTSPDGATSEFHLQYATIVGDHVVSIVAAAYDPDGCLGNGPVLEFTPADLVAFRPHLERVLQETPLPVLG